MDGSLRSSANGDASERRGRFVGRAILASLCVLASSTASPAQTPFNVAVPLNQLALVFAHLYGPNGLIVDSLARLPTGATHSAHFNSDFQAEFVQFGTALTRQLVSVALPSPPAGFTYQFDPALGVFQRTSQSFGPILAERAQTIGGGRASLGFAYQRFSFDTIEGLDLRRVPAVFTHDSFELRGGREDVVTTLNSIDADVNHLTMFVTYGVGDRFDVSLAAPVVSVDVRVVSDARIRRIGTTNPEIHFFRSADGEIGDRRIFTAFGRAAGIGDVTVRLKGTAMREGQTGFAVGLDIRIPTGDEGNLLGAGGPGVHPFIIWSTTRARVSPHVNLGYLWNGSSVLAGDAATGEARDVPDHVSYVAGADFALGRRLTLAFDVVGAFLLDAPRLVQRDFHALDGRSVFPNIGFIDDSFNQLSGGIGIKVGLLDNLLLDTNLLFTLDRHGLRDKVSPLVGLEYAF